MSKRGNSDVLAEKKDESFETGSKINLLLPEGAEVVGILEAVTPDALIIRYSGHDTAVSIASDILEKAAQLIGRKVAILHFNHKFYIREIKDPISVSETPANKNRKAKKMKHLRQRRCCRVRRCPTEKNVFQTTDILW